MAICVPSRDLQNLICCPAFGMSPVGKCDLMDGKDSCDDLSWLGEKMNDVNSASSRHAKTIVANKPNRIEQDRQ
jgi:hypothetical protein